jgi:hypothetical protein
MSIQRDLHLPPPEVCDWLLAQEWSEAIPTTLTTFHPGGPGGITMHTAYDHVHARAALGADEVFAIELPVEALAVLRADAEARKLDHETDQVNEAQPDPETDLLRRVLADAEQADISAFGAIGVLTTAATMMVSQCCDLTLQEPNP